MSELSDAIIVAFILGAIIILTALCAGEPDLLDAIINYINRR